MSSSSAIPTLFSSSPQFSLDPDLTQSNYYYQTFDFSANFTNIHNLSSKKIIHFYLFTSFFFFLGLFLIYILSTIAIVKEWFLFPS